MTTCHPQFQALEGRRLLSAGAFDSTFGQGGKTTTPFGFFPTDMALQADGKIVVVGDPTGIGTGDFKVGRLNADGSVDTTFGGGLGLVTTDLGGQFGDVAEQVAIEADGKIVVGGTTYNSGGASYALVRYNRDGSLDTSFGEQGVSTVLDGVQTFGMEDMAIQPDGKIVFTSEFGQTGGFIDYDFITFRLNYDGHLDGTFGDSRKVGRAGYVRNGLGGQDFPTSILIQPDGKILVGGHQSGGDFGPSTFALMARYTPDGRLDKSFDKDGKRSIDLGIDARVKAMSLMADGRIVLAGDSEDATVLMRLNPDGKIDHSMGGIDGAVYTKLSRHPEIDGVNAVFARGDKIIMVGEQYSGKPTGLELNVVRFNSDGTRDRSFGIDGIYRPGVGFAYARSVAMTQDGRLVTATTQSAIAKPTVSRFTGIADPPTLQLTNGIATAFESKNFASSGAMLLTSDTISDFPIHVMLDIGGSARFNTDYSSNVTLNGSVVARAVGVGGVTGRNQAYIDMPVGKSSVLLRINVIDDAIAEGTEDASFTLQTNPGYRLGKSRTADVSIGDDELLIVRPFNLNAALTRRHIFDSIFSERDMEPV
jgi:uncharacterized delta-60 repeat protein